MTRTLDSHPLPLRAALDDIIAAHGRWRVLRALVVWPSRPAKPLPPLGLNDHLRRDIGLDPQPWRKDGLR